MENTTDNWAANRPVSPEAIDLEHLRLEVHRAWDTIAHVLRMIETRPDLPQNQDEDVVHMVKRFAQVGRSLYNDCLEILNTAHAKLSDEDDSSLWAVLEARKQLDAGPLNSKGTGPLANLQRFGDTIDQLTLLPYFERADDK